ncbi:hypothetical protein Tamer19_31910 [Cupriavidus sp. TA19]|nr:hypothetical protein Tamer19_31910 [Cupriavidus sp. TA19]
MTDAGGEVRELTSDDLEQFRSTTEALPESLRTKLGVRGPQKAPIKVALSLRVSPEVVEAFRATGRGWQTRMDAALVDWLKTHRPEELTM